MCRQHFQRDNGRNKWNTSLVVHPSIVDIVRWWLLVAGEVAAVAADEEDKMREM